MAERVYESHEPRPEAGSRPSPDEVAHAASVIMGVLGKQIVRWPAGVISGIGSLLAVAALGAELWLLDPLNTAEYVTTIIVGAILALVGPLVIGVDNAGLRSAAKKIVDATSSPAEQASQEAEERAIRKLRDDA